MVDLGPAQSVTWDATVPSKKRTCVGRANHSSVEEFTKELCSILHEQQSYFSASSEDDLLYENEAPMVSVEIGHGSILIRHPSYVARDEESEASSLSFDNRQYPMSDTYSYSGTVPMHNGSTRTNFSSQGAEKVRNSVFQGMKQEQLKRQAIYFVIRSKKIYFVCFYRKSWFLHVSYVFLNI